MAVAAEFNFLSQTKQFLLKHRVWSRRERLAVARIVLGKPSCVCSTAKVFSFFFYFKLVNAFQVVLAQILRGSPLKQLLPYDILYASGVGNYFA